MCKPSTRVRFGPAITGHAPEHAEIAALSQTRNELDNQVRDARVVVEDLTADQIKADQDVEQVKSRRRDQERIDQGLISNPKDLERMQHELESLERRIGVLEDEELEVMERLEEAQRVSRLAGGATGGRRRTGRALVAARDEKEAVLISNWRMRRRERLTLVADSRADLVTLYDRLREQKTASVPPNCANASARVVA